MNTPHPEIDLSKSLMKLALEQMNTIENQQKIIEVLQQKNAELQRRNDQLVQEKNEDDQPRKLRRLF